MTIDIPMPDRRPHYVALGAVCLAAAVLPLSFAGAAIATPAIGRSLGGTPLALNWVTNAFMLSFGSALMAAGAIADRFGRKRTFMVGLFLFIAVSLALGLSPDIVWLNLLRATQGVAAAATLAGGSAALAQEFHGKGRALAFSLLGTTFGVGLAFGPILAGLLVNAYGWRSIFLSGAAIGALALLIGVPSIRESRNADATNLDWPGTAAFTGMLALFTWAVLQAPQSGWASPLVIGLLVGAAALLLVFVLIERSVAHPALDLSLFRYPRFIGVQVLPIATDYCYVVLLVLLPIRFIGIGEHSEIEVGLTMIALSAPLVVVPVLAAQLSRRIPAGLVSGVGLLIAAAGLFLLSRTAAGQPLRDAVLPMLVIGVGAGMPWGLMDGLAVSVVPKERAGMATGIFSTTRVAGEGIALAVVSALLAALIQGDLAHYPAKPTLTAPHVAAAAQSLTAGDLRRAAILLPGINAVLLARVYDDAFRKLMYILIVVTLLCALIIFRILREPSDSRSGSGAT